jgi:hypothetical protein
VKDYDFLETRFTEPIVTGSNTSGLARPFLQFFRGVERRDGELLIIIRADFQVEGEGSNFRFEVIAKSSFKAKDASNIVIHDVFDMGTKTVEDLQAFLNFKIGKNGISTIGVPQAEIEDVLYEISDFIDVLRSQS